MLALPLAAGLSGLIFGYNPVIKLCSPLLKKPRSAYVLEDPEQQQFNQKIAVFSLAGGLVSFLAGWTIAGYLFSLMVGIAATVAILGFCIGCFLHHQWRMYTHRRKQAGLHK
ncbi:DUF4395 domain-containing protein [Paenibacillus sp. FSL R7-0337]|uniref:DUF4395 domain-containing protein n=1 Tax=Paenibacillus sp. FSL R7-0337 TaxID=1926588 RepID=UPI00273D3478|nr:DUF4395 domain-containing protein [Paenibacillus sp. FSL R7-0337]